MIKYFFSFLFLLACSSAAAQDIGLRECPRGGCGNSSGQAPAESSLGSNTQRAVEVLQQQIQRMNAEQEMRERDQEREREREVQAASEEAQRIRERLLAAESRGKEAVKRNHGDPALNPFGPRNAGGSQGGSALVGSNNTNGGTQSSESSQNIEGQPCKWFVVKDEETCSSRSCTYSEGQTVAVGESAYACRGGRWSRIRDCNQSPTAQQKRECTIDIVIQHGRPGAKEGGAVKIFTE